MNIGMLWWYGIVLLYVVYELVYIDSVNIGLVFLYGIVWVYDVVWVYGISI